MPLCCPFYFFLEKRERGRKENVFFFCKHNEDILEKIESFGQFKSSSLRV